MNTGELPKAYDAGAVEDQIYKNWEDSGYFNPDNLPDRNQKGEPYCIIMPPPNVTGVLHLGHALENALMDTMVRFQRMRGKRAVIIPGTDHAALPTQAKVEKMLMQEGMKNPRQELGREKLLARIRTFAEESQSTILSQVKKLGTSCDWSRLAFTFDDQRSKAVNEMFIRLFNDGLIYRGYRTVNWSVKGQSTCSDDEVEMVERTTKLYTFKYSKDFPISIASTQPETKLGDTAVAVHPDDIRYKKFIGQTFIVDVGADKPRNIKIIGSQDVDPEFGTGALGVTPAHSQIDFLMYEKQKAAGNPIELIPVIGPDGKMTAEAGSYQGLTTEQAREKFVEWLKDSGLLEKEEEILQNVGTSDRFGDVLEVIPMIQWWLDVNKTIPGRGKSLKELMREAMNEIKITPERFTKSYFDRVENLRDWCLSRQIWWGHRIPVWYKGEEMKASVTSPGEGWVQDEDTLDTWFSSGSFTFSTLGWPDETSALKTFHPTAWIQMGYEILYLWLMRMILMSTYALKEIPFKDAYIHGMLRDEHGKKFSKSAGNNIDPLEVIQKDGCDALRWSVMIGTTPGNDSKFYQEKVDGAHNLVNKLWNVSRFILTQLGEEGVRSEAPNPTTDADHWILSRLNNVISSVTQKIERYEFSSAGEELRDFTWSDLADWYLEIAKIEKGKEIILSHILKAVLKMWHPFMPFVTEYVWGVAKMEGRLIVAEWPIVDASRITHHASFEQLRTLVTDLRRLRSEQKIEPVHMVEFFAAGDLQMVEHVRMNHSWIERLVRGSVAMVDTLSDDLAASTSGSMKIGMKTEKQTPRNTEKELAELTAYIQSTERKLADVDFQSKAPGKVVQSMKQKLEEAKQKAEVLKKQVA